MLAQPFQTSNVAGGGILTRLDKGRIKGKQTIPRLTYASCSRFKLCADIRRLQLVFLQVEQFFPTRVRAQVPVLRTNWSTAQWHRPLGE